VARALTLSQAWSFTLRPCTDYLDWGNWFNFWVL